MENVNATRMNLLLKREEISTASSGAELLRNKRDVLLNEFFSVLRLLLSQREAMNEQAFKALRSFIFAFGLEGKEKISSFSFVSPQSISLEVSYKNLLGLKIPEIAIESYENENGKESIRTDSDLLLEETREEFQNFLKLSLLTLPQELKLKRLGQEIKSTTRKVNSLEKYVIPQLYLQVKFIRETLEEREREDIFRLKRLKRHLK